jgi:hypothetical protein
MRVGDTAADGKAEAGAPGLRSHEWIEDLVEEIIGDTGSGIRNFHE